MEKDLRKDFFKGALAAQDIEALVISPERTKAMIFSDLLHHAGHLTSPNPCILSRANLSGKHSILILKFPLV